MNTAQSSSLVARLAQLREESDTRTKSDSQQITPLRSYVILYAKARNECYIDYMQGAKLLWDWLSPIEIPAIDLDHSKYNYLYNQLINHELHVLAEHAAPYRIDANKHWQFIIAFHDTVHELIHGKMI